jgi:hypothetical protein
MNYTSFKLDEAMKLVEKKISLTTKHAWASRCKCVADFKFICR